MIQIAEAKMDGSPSGTVQPALQAILTVVDIPSRAYGSNDRLARLGFLVK